MVGEQGSESPSVIDVCVRLFSQLSLLLVHCGRAHGPLEVRSPEDGRTVIHFLKSLAVERPLGYLYSPTTVYRSYKVVEERLKTRRKALSKLSFPCS